MDSNGPSGRVTSSTGDVDLDGQLLGLIRENGTSSARPRYAERARLDDRLAAACDGDQGQAAAVRRLLGVAP